MKSLELSEKNKEQLLEMCSILFPELKNLEVRDSMEDFCHDFKHICVEFNRESGLKIIHWYEFSLNQIINKIAWKYTSSDICADVEFEHFRMNLITDIFKDKSVGEEFHIVDYLYNKHFKKLY